MNFVDMIFYYSNATPQKPAMILADRVVTYGMMASGIRSVTHLVASHGLKAGQIVAVRVESPTRHLIISAALYRLGIVGLSVNGNEELLRAGVKLDAMITDGGKVSWLGRTLVADDGWFGQDPGVEATPPAGFANDDDLARIIMSSGTTAAPKAIGMSARVVEDRIITGRRTLTIAPWDRMMVLPVITSSLGFGSALQALAYGHTAVFAFSAVEAMQLINLYGVDLLVSNPQHLKEMVALQETNPIPTTSLKAIKFGGNALSPALASEVRKRLCNTILCVFSSTESGPMSFGPLDRMADIPGASGYRAPWCEIEALGEGNRPVPPGTDGVLRVRSRWQGHDLAKPKPADGEAPWIYTGDYGRVGADGMVVLSGRVADMIRLPTKTLFPDPIEQALLEFPGVDDGAAMARTLPSGHQDLWILVKAKGNVDVPALKAFLLARDPHWVVSGVKQVDEVRRNDMRKIVRHRMREHVPD